MSTFIRLKQHNRKHFDEYLNSLSWKLNALRECRVNEPYHETRFWINAFNTWQEFQNGDLKLLIKTTPQ